MDLRDFYDLDDEKCDKFEKYMNLLIEWNKNINLTAITDRDDIILKHFADSLTISKYIADDCKVIDVGTGAGFPGIPLKIYNESLDITLLDSLNKRVNFLNDVIEKLDLKKICAVHSRAEDAAKNPKFREKFDVATSRAVANLSTLVEYLLPFVKVNGICICMKGPNVGEELNKARKAIEVLGGRVEKVVHLRLKASNEEDTKDGVAIENTEEKKSDKCSDLERNIIIIRKIKSCPNKYPRKAGMPSKEPIC